MQDGDILTIKCQRFCERLSHLFLCEARFLLCDEGAYVQIVHRYDSLKLFFLPIGIVRSTDLSTYLLDENMEQICDIEKKTCYMYKGTPYSDFEDAEQAMNDDFDNGIIRVKCNDTVLEYTY